MLYLIDTEASNAETKKQKKNIKWYILIYTNIYL